jgi:hypothetical protein
LLPTDDDRLRDDVEAVLRFHKTLTSVLLMLVDAAIADVEHELTTDLGDWLPCRALVLSGDGLQEIWCALSTRGNDGTFVSEKQRNLLFAELERHLQPVRLKSRNDWPSSDVGWWEVVRFAVPQRW